jgi:hypothetical protein
MVGLDAASKSFLLLKSSDPTKTEEQLNEADREKLEKAFTEVLQFCQTRLSGYEQDSKRQAKRAYWLSMSGLVAGSVIAPALTAANAAANAGWIGALSGWGGATNFAGQAYRSSGLSGTAIAQTRNDIIKNVGEQIRIASNGENSFEERKNALMQARAECIIYQIAVPSIPST